MSGSYATTAATGRKTSSPGNHIFSKFRKEFPAISKTIDYENINNIIKKFNWERFRGTEVGRKALEVRRTMVESLRSEVYKRGEQANAVNFIVLFLGVRVQDGAAFMFPDLAEVSNCRFLQRANYFILIALIIELPAVRALFTLVERRRIERLALFCTLYYAPYFLQTPIACR